MSVYRHSLRADIRNIGRGELKRKGQSAAGSSTSLQFRRCFSRGSLDTKAIGSAIGQAALDALLLHKPLHHPHHDDEERENARGRNQRHAAAVALLRIEGPLGRRDRRGHNRCLSHAARAKNARVKKKNRQPFGWRLRFPVWAPGGGEWLRISQTLRLLADAIAAHPTHRAGNDHQGKGRDSRQSQGERTDTVRRRISR